MKWKKVIPILLICVLLCGCWDKEEIDRRLFISTIGIDAGEEIGKSDELKKIKPDEPFPETEIKRLNITYAFPALSKLGPEKGGGGTVEESTINTDAYSLEDAFVKSTSKASRSISFGHTQLIIIGKQFLSYPDVVKEAIDYLQREPSLNRNMYIMIADGKVEQFVKFKPEMEKNIQAYISGLMLSSNKNATILPITLNEFLMLLGENGNAFAPVMTLDMNKKELKLTGLGLIKNYSLVGQLTPTETADLEILRGKLKGGTKVIYKEGHPLNFAIEGLERKISLQEQGGRLIYTINIKLEGQIKEYYTGKQIFSKKFIDEIQDDYNKSIKEECEKVSVITQKKFDTDPIGLREYTQKYHPGIYKKYSNNWNETYKSAQINVRVDTKVRRIGAVK